ncbi:MAG: RNA-binding S4 domain-containing protein [Fimbriimonas sp.]
MPESNETSVTIRGDLITLGQLVKLLGLIGNGGEAKDLLTQYEFRVNGEPDDRRGRKIRPGDRVTLPDGAVVLICGEPAADSPQ